MVRCDVCGEKILPQYDAMLGKDVYVHNNCKGKKKKRKTWQEEKEELINTEWKFPERCSCGLRVTEEIKESFGKKYIDKETGEEKIFSIECPRCEHMIFKDVKQ